MLQWSHRLFQAKKRSHCTKKHCLNAAAVPLERMCSWSVKCWVSSSCHPENTHSTTHVETFRSAWVQSNSRIKTRRRCCWLQQWRTGRDRLSCGEKQVFFSCFVKKCTVGPCHHRFARHSAGSPTPSGRSTLCRSCYRNSAAGARAKSLKPIVHGRCPLAVHPRPGQQACPRGQMAVSTCCLRAARVILAALLVPLPRSDSH